MADHPFAFTQEQTLIRDALRDFLLKHHPMEKALTAWESEHAFSPSLWKRMEEELNLSSLLVPESMGGAGLGLMEGCLVMEQMGFGLCYSPLFSFLTSGLLLGYTSKRTQEHLMPSVARGEKSYTFGVFTKTGHECLQTLKSPEATYNPKDGKYILEGQWFYVLDGDLCDGVFLLARKKDHQERCLFFVPLETEGMEYQKTDGMDRGMRQGTLRAQDVKLSPEHMIMEGKPVDVCIERLMTYVFFLQCAEMLGAASRALEMTVAYTKERVQFGVPIASFQSVAHQCADFLVAVESMRSCLYGHLASLEDCEEYPAEIRAMMTKSFLSQEAFSVCGGALQMHGGMGFTWEYPLHLLFKRTHALGAWGVSVSHLRERIANFLGTR